MAIYPSHNLLVTNHHEMRPASFIMRCIVACAWKERKDGITETIASLIMSY